MKKKETLTALKNQIKLQQLEIQRLDSELAMDKAAYINIMGENLDSERKKFEETLEHLTTHDHLTDLPNRSYLEKLIENVIGSISDNEQCMALIHLDLDNFKLVNDALGHSVGDRLLKEVSTLLLQNVSHHDIVARLGGDEFVIILKALKKPGDAADVCQRLLIKFDKAFNFDEKEVYINASLGIAVYPFCGSNAVELLKNADMAMYAAKRLGKNQYRFFTQELSRQTEQNIKIISGLRHAISKQELRLQYQPIIDMQHLTCVGIEVLVRWQHPQLGLLFPDQFLSYAEDIGTMLAIGRWIFQQALDDYKRMDLESLSFVSINMSATEFTATEVNDFIVSSMIKRAIIPSKLVVELTETVIMYHPEIVLDQMKRLTDVGVRIAIDDYGMGYS